MAELDKRLQSYVQGQRDAYATVLKDLRRIRKDGDDPRIDELINGLTSTINTINQDFLDKEIKNHG